MADIFDRLRDFPDEQFRISLKEKLMQAATVTPERPSYLPEGFRSITPYLITSNATGIIDFMTAAFGATERMRVPRPDGTLMHGEVNIGDCVIEISDGTPQYPPSPVSLHLYVPDVDITYERAISTAPLRSSGRPTNRTGIAQPLLRTQVGTIGISQRTCSGRVSICRKACLRWLPFCIPTTLRAKSVSLWKV